MSGPVPGRSVRRRAHAKINLCLSVGRAERASTPAGLHPISSWMAAVDLADDVEVTALEPGAASRHRVEWASDAPRPSPIDWPIEKDLAVRAHRLLEAHVGHELPVEIIVRKRTPVGGGLGGGSSDGAAALCGVNELFALGLSMRELARLSSALGSDVAFFVDDASPARPAVVGGFGGRIDRVAPVAGRVLLLLPPFGTPTGPVYRAYDASPRGLRDAEVRGLVARSAAAGRVESANLFNDLAVPACVVEPRLGELLERLRGGGVTAHVSGSGSTLFVIDATEADEGVARRVAPEAALVATRLV